MPTCTHLLYFEYLAAGLNVVATDLNNETTIKRNIEFYDAEDFNSFDSA